MVQPSVLLEDVAIYTLSVVHGEDSVVVALLRHDQTWLKKFDLLTGEVQQDWLVRGEVHQLFSDGQQALMIEAGDWNTFVRRDFCSAQADLFFGGHTEAIVCLSLSEEAGLAVSSSEDCMVKVWQLWDGFCRETIKVLDYAAQVMLATEDVVIGWEGQPALWAFDMAKHRFLFQKDDVQPTVVKLNLDGNSILVGHQDGTVGCYALANGEMRWARKLHEGWVSNLITCPALSLIVTSGSDGLLCLVDAASGDLLLSKHQIREIEPHIN